MASRVKKEAPKETTLSGRYLADYLILCGFSGEEGFNEMPSSTKSGEGSNDTAVKEPLRRPYMPTLFGQYPKHVSWNPVDARDVVLFCFPKGVLFRKEDDGTEPSFHTFVMTRENGDRVYGAVLIVYEEVQDPNVIFAMKMLQDMFMCEMAGNPGKQRPYSLIDLENQNIYAPKAICLVSKFPYVRVYERYLRELYIISRSRPTMPIESFVYNLLYEVPLPSPGKSVRFVIGETVMVAKRPEKEGLPLLHFSFDRLLGMISPETILKLLSCVMLEKQILFCSSDISALTLACEILTAFAFPFSWAHVYIPILPDQIMHILQAPMPLMIGIHKEKLEVDSLPPEIIVVDLDNDELTAAEDLLKLPYEEELASNMTRAIRRHRHEAKKGGPPKSITARMRVVFLDFFVKLMQNYENYVRFPSAEDWENYKDGDEADLFDKVGFLSEHPPECMSFLSLFLESQSFAKFIDEKLTNTFEEEQPQINYFERLIAELKGDEGPPRASNKQKLTEFVSPEPHILPTHPDTRAEREYPVFPSLVDELFPDKVDVSEGAKPPVSKKQWVKLQLQGSNVSEAQKEFATILLKDATAKCKKLVLMNIGREAAFELGHGDIGVVDSSHHQEDVVVNQLCEIVERIFGHGLKVKKGTSALWHLLRLGDLDEDSTAYERIEEIEGNKELKADVSKSRAFLKYCIENKTLAKCFQELYAQEHLLQAWYQDYAFMRDDEYREQLMFQLLSLAAVDIKCYTRSFGKAGTMYRVNVFTGDGFNMGTSANVFLSITGDNGTSPTLDLKKNFKCSLSSGKEDIFSLQCSNLGDLHTIKVGHDNSGLKPGWFLIRILVTNLKNEMSYEFACNKWLAKDEGDGEILRSLSGKYITPEATSSLSRTSSIRSSHDVSRSSAINPGTPTMGGSTLATASPHSSLPSSPVVGTSSAAVASGAGLSMAGKSKKKKRTEEEVIRDIASSVNTLIQASKDKEAGVTTTVSVDDVVEEDLALCFHDLFRFGFKASNLFGSKNTPWDMVESVASKCGGAPLPDNVFVDWRNARTLPPLDLFKKAVERVSNAHYAVVQMKFRALVAMACNLGMLHLWFKFLTENTSLKKFYDSSAFVRTPRKVNFIMGCLEHVGDYPTQIGI
eukprot:Nk52_evm10s270 gene=Nk52_evmTU10s270